MSGKMSPTVDAAQLRRAKQIIRSYTKEVDWDWGGVSPSYLCADMGVGYETAEALLLALEAEGFIYDNGNGGPLTRPDGTPGRNRFYPTAWLDKMTPEQRRRWEAQHAKDVEWDRREAEWNAANIPEGTPFLFAMTAQELMETKDNLDAYLALKARRLQEHLAQQEGSK